MRERRRRRRKTENNQYQKEMKTNVCKLLRNCLQLVYITQLNEWEKYNRTNTNKRTIYQQLQIGGERCEQTLHIPKQEFLIQPNNYLLSCMMKKQKSNALCICIRLIRITEKQSKKKKRKLTKKSLYNQTAKVY